MDRIGQSIPQNLRLGETILHNIRSWSSESKFDVSKRRYSFIPRTTLRVVLVLYQHDFHKGINTICAANWKLKRTSSNFVEEDKRQFPHAMLTGDTRPYCRQKKRLGKSSAFVVGNTVLQSWCQKCTLFHNPHFPFIQFPLALWTLDSTLNAVRHFYPIPFLAIAAATRNIQIAAISAIVLASYHFSM